MMRQPEGKAADRSIGAVETGDGAAPARAPGAPRESPESQRESPPSMGHDPLHLHIDAERGIAGDMLLAALFDWGVPMSEVQPALARVLPPFRLELERVDVRGMRCARLRVCALDSTRAEGPVTLPRVRRLLGDAKLPAWVAGRALHAFELLARAEARVHGSDAEHVHFHEVGALDSLVDILGTLLAVHHVQPAAISCSSLPLGSGDVMTSHGIYPVPAPATLLLLEGVPTHPFPVKREVTTPTGAALARVLAGRFGAPVPGRIGAVGCSTGARAAREDEPPNVLRVLALYPGVATTSTSGGGEDSAAESIAVLETNVDHLPGEEAGFLLETLLEAGALDVFLVPTQGKKSRPGLLITVLAEPARAAALEERLFAETGTLGVRTSTVSRRALRREWREIQLADERVRVKCAYFAGRRISAAPEFDDLSRIARRTGRPLRELRREAAAAIDAAFGGAASM